MNGQQHPAMDFIFFAWWIMSGADGIGALMAGLRLRELRLAAGLNRTGRRLAYGFVALLFSLAFEAFLTTLSLYFTREFQGYTLAYMVVRLIGRTVKAIGVWYLVFYVLGFRRGNDTSGHVLGEDTYLTESGTNIPRMK
jgi:hypothetical protein